MTTNAEHDARSNGRFENHQQIVEACRVIEQSPTEFLQRFVASDVHWTVTNPVVKSTPIAGVNHSREEFVKSALVPLSEYFSGPLQMKVVDLISQFPDQSKDPASPVKVCLELEGTGTLKRDQSEWKNYYSWVMHFQGQQATVVRAYLDSSQVNVAMQN